MSKYIFLLFFPSICMLITAFILWLLFIKIPQIWNKLFGTHIVVCWDIEYTTYETRRNLNNKLVCSQTMPNFSYLLYGGEHRK